jgi:hypothetical protein
MTQISVAYLVVLLMKNRFWKIRQIGENINGPEAPPQANDHI